MSEVLDFYQKQAKEGLSSIPWLAELQEKGLRELSYYGFPTRHDEEWKYTMVDALLKQQFNRPQSDKTEEAKESDIPVKHQVNIQNGRIIGIEALAKQLPSTVILQPLFQGLMQYENKVKPYLDKLVKHEHGFHALNTAFLNIGIVIYVPAGLVLEEPIVLSHWQDREQAVHTRHLIVLEEGAEATVIEDYRGAEQSSYFTNTITEVWTGKYAKLTHYKIQRESKAAYHIGQISVQQEENSQFDSHSLSLGGKLVRSDLKLYLNKEGATCLMNGIYAPTDGQHIDHHTAVYHLVPNCRSEQDYKGILTGRSRAVFNGKVVVAKDAQHTDARQQNKNLLLSAQAEIDTKPQLEIFADDVVCTHGATVGQLDEEALFYLATRGISKQEASHYLIQAFAADNLRLVSHRPLAEWMGTLLTQQLR
ncbi:Fe-S cluster assembly protein SufD [Legionella jamestowniensis]|uniref:ABC transporter permease n=1 Tax=Legionella jamestowniensis TaxID=455 RepID=A0A0W0ULE3_9GAMM|nr:Fe-S cluster assembly protein SufD [Legionella jamestowniensis]KTD08715.1 ABC transporter permease [Legionella jamestowniensis]OCH96846.1 Fe-S cluster assembly protein SufD [Legionella jamestowniensis]SFL55451.1 Iron-regulated ABC transporter permease protein SufD [Legionella jamestowniensis DSM 19215]